MYHNKHEDTSLSFLPGYLDVQDNDTEDILHRDQLLLDLCCCLFGKVGSKLQCCKVLLLDSADSQGIIFYENKYTFNLHWIVFFSFKCQSLPATQHRKSHRKISMYGHCWPLDPSQLQSHLPWSWAKFENGHAFHAWTTWPKSLRRWHCQWRGEISFITFDPVVYLESSHLLEYTNTKEQGVPSCLCKRLTHEWQLIYESWCMKSAQD